MRSGGSSRRCVSTPPSLEGWLAHLRHERRLSPHTLAAYERDAALLVAMAEARPPESLRTPDIRRFVATLHGKGLAPRSLARVLSAWRGFYEWLARKRAVAANPCAGVRAPRAAKTLPQTLSPDEAVRLVSLDDGSPLGLRDRALFELAYSSGLRVSELAGLDVDSLDAKTGEARVLGKGSKTRIVPVGTHALAAIAAWLPRRAQMAKPGEKALFIGARGTR